MNYPLVLKYLRGLANVTRESSEAFAIGTSWKTKPGVPTLKRGRDDDVIRDRTMTFNRSTGSLPHSSKNKMSQGIGWRGILWAEMESQMKS